MSSIPLRTVGSVTATSAQPPAAGDADSRRLARMAERHRERRISLMTTALFMIASVGTFSFGHMLVFWH